MKSLVKPLVKGLDRNLARLTLALGIERQGLMAFMFHHLFEDRREAAAGQLDAFQPVTLEDFRRFIEHLLEAGYDFVGPEEILAGLDPTGRQAIITFDDGYANNLRALPVLKEFGVPALFFISANHVREGRAYWWDALYRRRRAQGVAPQAIDREAQELKRLPHDAIEAGLVAEFGAGVLTPLGDSDRPMTESELKSFAAEPLVRIGNHSCDHAILTVLAPEAVRAQIRGCQDYLEEVTGQRPRAIAYPNGNQDAAIQAIAAEEGLELGFATHEGRSVSPLAPEERMALPRFAPDGGPDGGPGIVGQCQVCRSVLPLVATSRRLGRRLRRRLGPRPGRHPAAA